MSSTQQMQVTVIGEIGRGVATRLVDRIAGHLDADGFGVLAPPGWRPSWNGAPGVLPLTGEVVERSAGCPCCGLRLDVVDGLLALHRRTQRPRRVVVVLAPGEDALTVAQTLLADAGALRVARLDGLIAAVDGPAMATRLGAGLTDLEPVEARLLAATDRVAVAGAGNLTDDGLAGVTSSLAAAAPVARILAPQVSRTVVGDLVDLDAWSGPLRPTTATRRGGLVAAELVVPGALDLHRLESWGDDATGAHGPDLHRIQGTVWIDGEDRPHRVQGVRAVISGARLPAGVDPGPRLRNHLTIVGDGLDADELRAGLYEAVVA